MKGKAAKTGGRLRYTTGTVVEENVAIEYLELTITDAVTEVTCTELVRTNHGVIEAAGAGAQSFIGYVRARLEQHIVEQEEKGLDISLRSLVGINYIRASFPRLDADLVLDKGCFHIPIDQE